MLFEREARLCNNIPYGKAIENLCIRPADFMHPICSYEDLPATTSHPLDRVRQHQTRLTELIDETLRNDWERYQLGEKNTGSIKKHVGDLVMFKNNNKHNKTEYGLIKRLVPAQTLEIQTRRSLVI